MRLVSSAICKKPSLDIAEDFVGGHANFHWLLDGATPPVGGNNHALTCKYVQMLDRGLTMFAEGADNPKELLFKAIEYVKENFGQHEFLPSSTVVIVQVLEECIQYLVLGDSFLCIHAGNDILVETDNRVKLIAVEERQFVRELRLRGVPETGAEYIEARKNLIRVESENRNRKGGYWIAELDSKAAEEAKTGVWVIDNDSSPRVFAATDGLERLVSVFGVYPSLKELGEAIWEKGAASVFDQLRTLEENPSNFKRPISSKHDDASYFLLQ